MVYVLDGALGTQLESRVPVGSPLQIKSHPLWSAQVLIVQPDLIADVHRQYVDSGANIVTTASYQALAASLARYADMGLAAAEKLWDRSVALALDAAQSAQKKVFVAGSVGPYACYLANASEYTGDYGNISVEQLYAYHMPLARYMFAHDKVDVVAFETMANFNEVKAVVYLVKDLLQQKQKPFYLSLSMTSPAALADGTPVEKIVAFVDRVLALLPKFRANFFAFGCNCVDYNMVTEICANIDSASVYTLPKIVYPNLGMVYDSASGTTYDHLTNVKKWNNLVQEWVQIPGMKVIGGCCSTGPKEIEVVKRIIEDKVK